MNVFERKTRIELFEIIIIDIFKYSCPPLFFPLIFSFVLQQILLMFREKEGDQLSLYTCTYSI